MFFDIRTFALVIVLLVLTWSGYQPHDYFTWLLEVLPVLVNTCDPDGALRMAVTVLVERPGRSSAFCYAVDV